MLLEWLDWNVHLCIVKSYENSPIEDFYLITKNSKSVFGFMCLLSAGLALILQEMTSENYSGE